MKQLLTTAVITLFISLHCYSQTTYNKGYFITNNGEEIVALIKNKDWKNNPKEINFKVSENAEVQTTTIESMKEFGIYGKSKYIRATVNIDKSRESLKSLDMNRMPVFEEEQVFLKVLIEGKASLYSYEGSGFQKFFFKTENSNIEELVYKSYLTNDNKVAKNNQYKQQLANNLKCPELSSREFQDSKYSSSALVNLFKKYHSCADAGFISYSKKRDKASFSLSIKAGINSSSLQINNSEVNYRDTDFGNEIGFRVGVEAESVLPFFNDKWSVLFEPAYQNFSSEKETEDLKSKVNYNSIELPFGIRHYIFLDENSKIFVNGLVVMVVDLDSNFEFERGNPASPLTSTLEIKSGTNLALGVGYNYNQKYSVELRYYTNRDVLTNYGPWNSDFKTLSLILDYSIF